jgi:hypothetical protein
VVWALILLGTVGAGTVASEGAAPSGETPAPAPRPGAAGISLAGAVAAALGRNFAILAATDSVKPGLREGEKVALRDPTAPSSDFGAASPP